MLSNIARVVLVLLGLAAVCSGQGRQLVPPEARQCANRPSHSTMSNGNKVFYSWLEPSTRNQGLDWLDARNFCRVRCMDLVSFERAGEYDQVKAAMTNQVRDFWTSGRLCDFGDDCKRADLLPSNINGWFWSALQTDRSGLAKMPPTNNRHPNNDWSHTGSRRAAQPDGDGSCMVVKNNAFGDGIKWHDEGCFSRKAWVCEDVRDLLGFARQTNRGVHIP